MYCDSKYINVLKHWFAKYQPTYGQLKQRKSLLLSSTNFYSDLERSGRGKISDHASSKDSFSASSDWLPSKLLMKKDSFFPFPNDVHS